MLLSINSILSGKIKNHIDFGIHFESNLGLFDYQLKKFSTEGPVKSINTSGLDEHSNTHKTHSDAYERQI